MRRDELASLGIQLPVLPTIVIGGLPGGSRWAARLEGIGLDVVSSGAAEDTSETVAAAVAAVPHRPVKATGAAAGARIVECGEPAPDGTYRIDPDELVAVDLAPADPNAIAREVLAVAADDPSAWWVAATGLADLEPEVAAERLAAMVEGVRQVRLYLAKRQFE